MIERERVGREGRESSDIWDFWERDMESGEREIEERWVSMIYVGGC